MTDHELLLAISGMLDTKLRAEIQTLKAELHEEMQALKAELYEGIQAVRAELYREIQTLRTEVQGVKAELQEVRAEVQGVKAELQEVRVEVQTVKTELRALKEEVHCIKAYQQDVIMPRLNTIEECYTGTYRRYARYVEKMESVFQDVEVLKVVVAEHSEKLKKLA